MMASSLPLVTTGLRRPQPTTSRGGGHGGARNEDPLNWCAWAHQGHRLWAGMPESFWVYTYKVERCPFPGNHVWMTCPYAHRGERARRRDPRLFSYAADSCPDYAESKRRNRLAGSNAPPRCPRGLLCGYAHGLFETWLHPTRFRTVLCQGGAECPRRVCFFAHCLAQRRREDDEVPLVVFPVTYTPPPPAFVPRAPRPAPSPSSSAPQPRSVSVVTRPVDRVTQAMQQGRSVRLLTRSDAAGASSSSSPSSRALVVATTATAAAVAKAPAPLLQASPSPVDKAHGDDYPHFDLIMDIVRS